MNISTQSMRRTEPVEVSKGHSKGRKLLTLNSSLLTVFAVLLCLLVGGKAWGQTTLTVCDGSVSGTTTATCNYVPIYGLYVDTNNQNSEFVIPAETYGMSNMIGGTISKLAFYITNNPATWGNPTVEVYMGEVDGTTISSLNGPTNFTSVWTGTLSNQNATMEITLSTPYIYNGGNLLIGMIVRTKSDTWKTTTFTGISADSGSSRYNSGSGTGIAQSFLPKTTFTYTPGAAPSCPILTIANATQWNAFAQCVADGNNYSGQTVTLTNDITVNTIVPGTPWTTSSGFHGTFDGQGHTITLNYTTSDNFVGLFRYTYGATIKDLIVDGTINTSNVRTGGLIGLAQYTTTITNCRSNVTINSTYSGPAENGGFVGDAVNKITFTGCVFSGRLLGGNATQNGGFVGYYHYDNYVRTYKDCLFAPSEVSFSTTESATFGRPYASTMNGSYYIQSFGTAQGTQAYSVTGITPVTVAMNGTPTRTYNVSGIDVYATGIVFDNTIYAASGSSLSLNLDGSDRGYLSDHGTLTGSANPYTLAMDAYNTKIAINCLVTSFPWEEDFEGFSASSSGVKLEDPCWVNEHIEGTGAYFFEVYSGTNGTNSTKQVRLRDMDSGTKTKLMLPPMDFGGVAYQFSLDVFRNATGTNYGEGVRVYASTDGNIEGATELAFISRSYQTSDGNLIPAESASGWYRYELILPHTGTCYIILRGESQYGSSTYMDNFRVELAPTCPKPINLTVSDITTSSARLAWDAGGTETSWQSFCALHGESPQWNNPYWTIINNVNSNVPANIPNPQPNTEYDFYVRANCGGGDYSEPIMITFRTACGAYTVTEGSPYIENFNSYSGYSTSTTAPTSPAYPNHTMPDCWTFVNMSASTSTYPQMFLTTNSGYPVSGNCLFFKSSSSTAAYAVLPSFSNNIENLVLAFSYRNEGTGTNNGTLHVGISNNLSDLENSYIEVSNFEQTTTITSETVTFATATTERGNYYIVFKYVGGTNNYYLSIDNVEVRLAPSCIIPDGLNETSVAATSATLEWMGISDSYNVRYHVPAHVDGFYEEFGSASIPTGWENKSGLLSNVMGGTALTSGSDWYFGTSNGVFDNHARINIWGTSKKNWLITPEVTVGSGYTFSFDLALTAYSGTLGTPATTGTDDRFVVLISTDNEATWSILREWNNNGSSYVYNNISHTATGENVSINISSYVGQTIRIAFYGESTTSNADNNLHIDNVKIGKSVAATAWQTQVVNSESSSITGLSPETTYEWQVQSICGNSTSDWCDLSTFTTIAMPPCTPPDVSIGGGTTPTCSGTQQTLTANVSGGETPYSYTWGFSATGSGSSTISSNAATVSVTPSNTSATASTITYKVTVNDNAGCSNTATKDIVVKKQPNPSFSPASTTLLVGGADYNALATLNADGCSSPTWTSSPSGIVTQAGGSIHAVAQGNTTVTASYAATANYCAASANLAVVVNIPHSVTISSASAACTGSGTSITASAAGFTNPQYTWSASPNTVRWPANTNLATINVTATEVGNYTFTCEVTESGGGASYSIGDVLYTDSNGDLAPSGTACYVMSVSGNKFTVLNSITCGGPHYADGYVATTGMTGKAATEALIPLSPTSSMVKLLVDNGHYAKGWYIPSADEINAFASSSDGRSVFLSVGNFNTPAPHYTSTVSSEGKVTTFGVTRPGGTPTEIYSETTYSYNGSGPGAFLAKDFSIGVSASTSITVGQSPVIGGFPIDPSVEECGSYTITPTVSTASCVATTWQWSDGDVSTGTPSLRDIDADGDYTFYATYSSMQQYDMITQNGIRAIVVKVPTATTDGIAVPISNNTIAPNSPSTPANISDSYIANLQEAIKVNGGNTYSGSRPGFVIPAGAAGGVCRSEATINVTINNPNIQNASNYNYIWKGGTAGNATDWNTASNWYVYSGGTYSIADVVPPSSPLKNIYIGNHNCKSNLTPNVNCDNAYANNITIASDASLTISANKTLNIKGNLINEGTFSAADSSLVVFVGASDQSIGSTVTFSKVKFEQTNSGTKINAPYGITVTGTATFNKGIVNGNMTFNAKAKALNVTNYESFVAGTVTKKTGSSSETNFVFPTGSAASGQPKVLGSVQVATLAGSKTTTVTFHQKSNDNGDGSHGFTLSDYPRWWNINDMCSNDGDNRFDHVSNYEYWDISAALSGITLKVNASSAAAHFSGTAPGNGANSNICAAAHYDCWKNLGGTATVSGSGGTITVSGVNIPSSITRGEVAFDGILTLGSKSENVVLPIELTSFTATCDGRSSIVEWATATERNNDFFVLERSDDAINFKEIARIAGAGNSIESIDYSYTDYGIHGGDNYYRLVQVDYDGTRSVSEIVVANCVEPEIGEPDVLAYPNPFGDELTIELENFDNRPARIEVYDVLGKLIYIQKADAPQNSYQTVLYLNNLPPATYNVRVSTADFVINKKVIKQ